MKGESKNNKKLELNQARKKIFVKAMEETEKIKKTKKEQDISCGKVVYYINQKEKNKR